MSTVRGRLPRLLCLAGGISDPKSAHCRLSDRKDIAFSVVFYEPWPRAPILIGCALTIQQIYSFANPCFRIAS